jgi:ABC transporter substrate binding protein (PQQ-dependent alcohol dehydrogenase system)
VFRSATPEPSPGAELAVKDTRAMAHAAGVTIEMVKRSVPEGDAIEQHLHDATDDGPVAVIADLPADDFLAVAKAASPTVPVFNIRHQDDALRGALCGSNVFHVAPSTSMLTDALAQFTVQKNWRRVLVLRGPISPDQVLADAFTISAKKFGARVVDTRQFAYGNDPRKRDEIDVALMTNGDDYDVVFLADTGGDFGRTVPYQLAKPRPVIGTEGLMASAWVPYSERFGSPQVNHRFQRLAHRDMGELDFGAWVSVRAVMEAVIRAKAETGQAVSAALTRNDIAIDVSKGIQSSFRSWDHQLRQVIELHTADAVLAYAPYPQFLHQRSPLDTLGTDEPESPCRPK